MKRLADLRFVIGSFLNLIGLVVLAAHVFGPDDIVQGVPLNLMTAILLLGIGSLMMGVSYLSPLVQD